MSTHPINVILARVKVTILLVHTVTILYTVHVYSTSVYNITCVEIHCVCVCVTTSLLVVFVQAFSATLQNQKAQSMWRHCHLRGGKFTCTLPL